MCGLMFLAGPVPDQVVAATVAGASKRGPHTAGSAVWSSAKAGWSTAYRIGPLGAWRPRPTFDTIIVGHSRLATSTARPGDVPDPAEGQPLIDGRYLVAHNGTLADDELDGYDGPVDSGAILRWLTAGRPVEAFLGALRAPQALVWADGEWVCAARFDGDTISAHPLYLADGENGPHLDWWIAVSSGPLPGGRLLEANTTHQLWRLP